MLANALTNDRELKGPRLATNAAGAPLVDGAQYPTAPIGWTTWWGDEPRTCFPRNGSTICSTYGAGVSALSTDPAITNTRAIDPQIGWEQQKFLIAWTMLFLPENQQQKWVDMMRVWEIGIDSDPVFQNRIEFHAPTGKVYAAKTYGTEEIFGKTIQRGIAARVLEYANSLLVQAYETTTVTENGVTWYVPVIDPVTGSPRVLFDDTVSAITPEGFVAPQGKEGCDAADNSQCTCTANRACMELESYITIPAYLRESVSAYGIGLPSIKGIY
jgi:hypothetical protein